MSDEEKEEWDALEWDEEGSVPDRVEAGDLNKWLFNKDTVDKVLEHLMANGIKVAGGDRLGKTIIFAKNSLHAQFITERFDANYPHLRGEFARLIDYSVSYAGSLIDDFSEAEKTAHIAVSMDMLDTGIDIPEVVNLVFFKIVRSKTKFWRMVGRGTRLCPDLFAPGEDKEEFVIFDFCQNLEFFKENPAIADGTVAKPIGERLFAARVNLIGALQDGEDDNDDLSSSLKFRLQDEVSGMNLENFLVRRKRRSVERFQSANNWNALDLDARMALLEDVAGLPSSFKDDSLPAKQFDLLALNAQLLLLNGDASFTGLQDRIKKSAAALETLSNVPMVAKEMVLILEIQTNDYWADVTVDMLEEIRVKLRNLVELIKPIERKIVITDFEDEIGPEANVDLPDVGSGVDKGRFKMKVRKFLDEHANHIALLKLKRAEQLTQQDLSELERMFLEEGITDPEKLAELKSEQGLGIFLRSLTGLDRAAAKEAFSSFTSNNRLNGNQTEFLNLVIDYLSESGIVEPKRFYESPFTDFDDLGIAGVFSTDQAKRIIQIVRDINNAAAA